MSSEGKKGRANAIYTFSGVEKLRRAKFVCFLYRKMRLFETTIGCLLLKLPRKRYGKLIFVNQ